MTDLDIAAGIIDDARHALKVEPAKRVLWSSDAARIVREWEDRKRRALPTIPAHVIHHQNEATREES